MSVNSSVWQLYYQSSLVSLIFGSDFCQTLRLWYQQMGVLCCQRNLWRRTTTRSWVLLTNSITRFNPILLCSPFLFFPCNFFMKWFDFYLQWLDWNWVYKGGEERSWRWVRTPVAKEGEQRDDAEGLQKQPCNKRLDSKPRRRWGTKLKYW